MTNISTCIPYYVLDQQTEFMTLDCMEEFAATKDVTDEVITADDASPYPHTIDGSLRHLVNKGNAAAWNTLIKHSDGEVIFLVDNDVLPTPGWRAPMLKTLETYDVVFPVVYNEKIEKWQRENDELARKKREREHDRKLRGSGDSGSSGAMGESSAEVSARHRRLIRNDLSD